MNAGRSLRSSLKDGKAIYMAKGGRRPKCFEAGGMICGHRFKERYGSYPQRAEKRLKRKQLKQCRGLWRAGYIAKGVRPIWGEVTRNRWLRGHTAPVPTLTTEPQRSTWMVMAAEVSLKAIKNQA